MIDSVSESAGAGPDLKKSRRQKQTLAQRGAATLDRLPPNDGELEMGSLGCVLLSPNECLDELIDKTGGDKLVYYDLRNQTIFENLVVMRRESRPIDLITVQQFLKDKQLLEQVGGIAYLSQMQDSVPSAANLGYYIEQIKEKYLLRRYIQIASGIVGRIYDYVGDVDILSGEVEREILAVAQSRAGGEQLPAVDAIMGKVIAGIEAAWESDGRPTGISTGFSDIDALTDGFHGGEFIIIAARPSVGKTALAMQIAEHVALDSRLPVGVFSLEMTAQALIERCLGARAHVNIRDFKRHRLATEADQSRIIRATAEISAAPLHIDDTSGLSILQLRARARRMVKDHGIKLFIVDYLQLLNSSTAINRNENREREIADISQGLKAMAKELNVPVVALSQLNRESEKTGGRPKLSQLRESGSLEQDADCAFLLYRPNAGDDDATTEAEAQAGYTVTFYIAKQRNGPRDVPVNLTYIPQWTRFEQQAPSHGVPEPDYLPHPNN